MKHPSIKKTLACIFAIAMIFSLMPDSSFAADEILPEQTEIVTQAIEDEAVSESPEETEEAVSSSKEDESEPERTEEAGETEEAVSVSEEAGGDAREGTDIPEEAVSVSEEEGEDGQDNTEDEEETEEDIPLSDGAPVKYLDRNGCDAECTTYREIDGQCDVAVLTNGFYVVSGDVNIGHSVTVKGNVSLILKDICHFNLTGSLSIPSGSNSLTIYAQSTSEETMGVLIANAYDYSGKAGIEVNSNSSGLIICGGNVKAIAGIHAAGIGGNEDGDSGSITILAGKVDAIGGWRGGAGIGGGRNGDCKNVTICGGNVIATGGEYGAGIGGGYEGDSVDTITISGGHVEATGGYFSAGIGGGYYGNANIVKITGGETVAIGDEGGAGIGGGKEAQFGTGGEFEEFVFTGGIVYAEAKPNFYFEQPERGMAIGAGYGGDDDVQYTLLLGNDHLLIDNETGNIADIGFSSDFSQILHGFGKREECNMTIVPTSAYPVSYLTQDEYGETVSAECKENYKLFYYNRNYTLELPSGWYVMKGEGEYENGIEIKGDVHLILTDGCKLTVRNGIRIGQGSELTIYGQSEGETAGKLISYGTYYRAGFGGSGNSVDGGSCGKLAVRGGIVFADGSYNDGAGACAGVGGICNRPGIKPVELSMYGGVLTASGHYGAPGIGGCRNAPGGVVNIYGGTINAISYPNGMMVGRAIGGYKDNPDNGTVYVGNSVVLIDNKTGKQITKGSDEEWIDKFAESGISITATKDMQPVSYMYYDGETGTYETGSCEKYLSYDNAGDIWNSGWYVFDGKRTFDKEIRVYGDVHVILEDGCQVTFCNGIYIYNNASLSIHSQSYGDNMGEMEVFLEKPTDSGNGKAGIRTTYAYLYVHGGNIKATGGNWGAGIGGGSDMQSLISEKGGNVTVYGGQLEGTGGNFAAGIGGGAGERGNGGTLTVIGGTVIAKGSGFAAGIGGGQKSDGGTVNLYGGTLKSEGGSDGGRAIGNGGKASGSGTINVKEGFVLIDNDTNEEIKNKDRKEWTEILTGESLNIRVEKKSEDDPTEDVSYKIIYGSDSAWTKGSKEGAQFVSDAEFAKFKEVKVDGAVVYPSCYTAEEGSTKVTLTAGYMESLKEGEHTLEIVSEDGSASTSFTVNAANRDNPSNPKNPGNVKTGDGSRTGLWLMLLVAAAAALCGTQVICRKKN